MKNLTRAVAVITGAASGMGAATAKLLAGRGAKVALLDLQIDKAIPIAEEINGLAVTCDVSDAQSAAAAFEKIKNQLGLARICVNCAGIAPAQKILGKEGVIPLEDFKKVLDINLAGTFNIMRLAAEQMSMQEAVNEEGERGVIINTASIAAYEGQIGQSAYSASKAGIIGMTLPAARELSRFDIRVMAIAPGIMDTPLLRGMPENVQKSLAEMVPFPKRFGMVDEFAALVLHIIENSYLNGEAVRLDGAIRMQPK